jgi:glycosyltransferase involved in cell wall biosynthesis
VRLLVCTDHVYVRERDGTVSTDRAFARFLDGLSQGLELVVIGRLQPREARSRYPLSRAVEFIPLPYYESLAEPARALGATIRSLRILWRALSDVDAVWAIGPTPLSIALALLARARRRPLFIGVRQDLPRYARSRHPNRRSIHLAADALEAANRALARRHAVVVVGDDLSRRYRSARHKLDLTASLISSDDLSDLDQASARSYRGEIRLLSVGRLEAEKNPLLLADILRELRAQEPRYRLVVCGEGVLEPALRSRLKDLGLADHADLLGYIPFDAGLLDVYRTSHVFLHVSWTEGLPQVLFEAWACAVPVVATDTGGVAAAAAGSALLIRPGDAKVAADAVARLANDPTLRAKLVHAGLRQARAHTYESERSRLIRFLTSAGQSR